LLRQIDGENASLPRKVANVKLSRHHLDCLQADGESEAHAGPVPTFLHERAEQALCRPRRKAAALVFDFDEDVACRGARAELLRATRARA
jgi:hypothetical protein